jgi:hypothetical protein
MVCLINIHNIKKLLNMSLNSEKELTIEGQIVEKNTDCLVQVRFPNYLRLLRIMYVTSVK